MSRKPTAIRLSKPSNEDDSEAPVKTSSTAKPKSKPELKAKAKPNKASKKQSAQSSASSAKSDAPRTPRVMEAPKLDDKNYDPFDQGPFVKDDDVVQVSTHLPDMTKGIRWGKILFTVIMMLLSIGFSLWTVELVESFFMRNPVLGWISLGLTVILAISFLALLLREFFAIRSLRKIGNLRQDSEQVLLGNAPAVPVLKRIWRLYSSRDDMQWYLDEVRSHEDDIMDDPDKIKLTENTLMKPLDEEAKQIISATAKRVSVITALNPSAVLDVLFVGYQVLGMLRKLMALYGGRPAFFSAFRLIRMVATHLAITGGLAVSDTILQQVLGKGIGGTLSRKVGEGTVNGIMATRIGIAAIDLCRPMPFTTLQQPSLKSFITELIGGKLN